MFLRWIRLYLKTSNAISVVTPNALTNPNVCLLHLAFCELLQVVACLRSVVFWIFELIKSVWRYAGLQLNEFKVRFLWSYSHIMSASGTFNTYQIWNPSRCGCPGNTSAPSEALAKPSIIPKHKFVMPTQSRENVIWLIRFHLGHLLTECG